MALLADIDLFQQPTTMNPQLCLFRAYKTKINPKLLAKEAVAACRQCYDMALSYRGFSVGSLSACVFEVFQKLSMSNIKALRCIVANIYGV